VDRFSYEITEDDVIISIDDEKIKKLKNNLLSHKFMRLNRITYLEIDIYRYWIVEIVFKQTPENEKI